MITQIKTTLLTGLFFFGLLANLQAQCKYKYKEKDVITGELNFMTDKFVLSENFKKTGVYAIRNLVAKFEKKGTEASLLINFTINSLGRVVIYTMDVDSMIIKFEDGDIRTIKLNKIVTVNVNFNVALSYRIDEALKKKFKSGTKVAGIRMSGINFNIDVSEFENQLSEKYNQCWVE